MGDGLLWSISPMLSDVRVGCCGWSVSRARYFADFPIIELQDPFYQMPSPALAAKWREAAPDTFEYCLKAWQLITHTPASPTYRRLKHGVSPSERDLYGSFRPTEQVWLAWERTEAVARILRASVILFQCPASFHPSVENIRNLRAFFGQVNRNDCKLAWEPRGDWRPGTIRDLCGEFDLVHCVDPFQAQSVYGQSVYWRLHGRGSYRHVYSDEELDSLKDQTYASIADGRGPIYVLFNNMSSKADALRFRAALTTGSAL